MLLCENNKINGGVEEEDPGKLYTNIFCARVPLLADLTNNCKTVEPKIGRKRFCEDIKIQRKKTSRPERWG